VADTVESPAAEQELEPWEVDDWSDAPLEEAAVTASRLRRNFVEWGVVFMLAVIAALLVRVFFFNAFVVRSDSMEPTLSPGDRILVSKNVSHITVGEIVVMKHPPGDTQKPLQENLVKRIIGLPGQVIYDQGNTIFINGRPLVEPWLPAKDPLGESFSPQTIPYGDYFVLGDNRKQSYDSRQFGFIEKSLIIGRVVMVVWHDGGPALHSP
jgi:signal peptidase I